MRTTTYEIDGFRSLRDFSITLNPGLNLLVGPNGSGKTNFIEFLDFLDRVVRGGASAAVSSAGGISRVFSIENSKKSSPTLSAFYSGEAEITERMHPAGSAAVFRFEYSVDIRFSRSHAAIFVSNESIKFKKLRRPGEAKGENTTVGSISISRRSPLEGEEPKWQIGKRLFVDSDRNPLNVMKSYVTPRTPEGLVQRIQGYSLGVDESILSIRANVPAIDAVRQALTHGRSFNIIPDRAREPDDLARPPIIQRDGAGLSATLHAMQSARKRPVPPSYVRASRLTPQSMDELIHWTRLVIEDLTDITTVHDPHTGKYLGGLTIDSEKPIKIPLQSVSDGTLKWLCLVCLIIAQGFAYSIEEPENFLHPKMQKYLVALIREYMSSGKAMDYFILSTHSESLINQCNPEELVLFEFKESRTSCRRISDPSRVQEEINNTGFGLGYYYASNALS